jgi:hypothetical protein
MKARKAFSITAILLVGAIIGGLAGSYGTAYITSYLYGGSVELQAAVAINQNVWVLKRLREGKIEEAIERLELELDGNLITLSADMPIDEQWQESVDRSLAFVNEYRSIYPRSTQNPEIDSAVANALSKAKTK